MIPLGLVPFSLLVPFATTISVSIWTAFCMLWLRQTRLRGSRRLLLLLVATWRGADHMTFAFAGEDCRQGPSCLPPGITVSVDGPDLAWRRVGDRNSSQGLPRSPPPVWLRRRELSVSPLGISRHYRPQRFGSPPPRITPPASVAALSRSAQAFMAIPTNSDCCRFVGSARRGDHNGRSCRIRVAAGVVRGIPDQHSGRDSFGLLLVGTLLFMPVAWTKL